MADSMSVTVPEAASPAAAAGSKGPSHRNPEPSSRGKQRSSGTPEPSSDPPDADDGAPSSPPPSLGSQLVWVLRRHWPDWASFLLMVGLAIGLQALAPVQQFLTADDMPRVSKPLLPDLVPFWAVVVVAVVFPLLLFLVWFAVTRDICDLHHRTIGLLYALVLTAILTDAFKLGVGRARPDFFWRCFPNGAPAYYPDGSVACTGTPSVVEEGRLSFPSGHTSWAFCGLGFLALWLWAKLKAFSPASGVLALLLPSLVALAGATAIGLSRIINYMHFPFDVFGGALIGLTMACLCYFMLYPLLTQEACEKPRIRWHDQSATNSEDATK